MGRGYWLKQFWKDKEVADAKEDGVPLADSNSLERKRHDKREWSQVVMKLTTAKEWLEAAQKSIKEET